LSLLIIGCGYVGRRLALKSISSGQRVAAITRGGQAAAELQQLGIEPVVLDWLEGASDWHLPFEPQQILVAVPHREDPRFGQRTHVVGLENVLARCPGFKRLVVLSTTGVYHQGDGSWVDESSPTEPTRIGPQIAVAAENWLREQVDPQRFASLRLAGIYGPGRVPLLAKLRAEEAIPVGEGSLNLIHLEDIVVAIERLLSGPAPSSLYVLSNGQPVERRQFYLDAARIFQTPPPRFVEATAETSRAARSESNKRINPAKILRELELTLQFPNHVSGLQALAAVSSP
jgi:nucleoside-diphosphate-sugar epimerase